jgi:hypothetical protein
VSAPYRAEVRRADVGLAKERAHGLGTAGAMAGPIGEVASVNPRSGARTSMALVMDLAMASMKEHMARNPDGASPAASMSGAKGREQCRWSGSTHGNCSPGEQSV